MCNFKWLISERTASTPFAMAHAWQLPNAQQTVGHLLGRVLKALGHAASFPSLPQEPQSIEIALICRIQVFQLFIQILRLWLIPLLSVLVVRVLVYNGNLKVLRSRNLSTKISNSSKGIWFCPIYFI